jgi:hypothetical protein
VARVRDRKARIAGTLSFWWPGLGQLYRREWTKGVLSIAASSALFQLAWCDAALGDVLACRCPAAPFPLIATSLALGALWFFSIRDARRNRPVHS